jgi:U3 small nucleolar RNA-associated protein 14
MADNFPHVFANREQYESSIRLPLGHEWNTLAAHRCLIDNLRPSFFRECEGSSFGA